MIALAKLAPEASTVPDVQVQGVALDSRRVTQGSLFIALQGETSDGHDFIDAAVAQGATAVFAERPVTSCEVPLVVVDGLAARVSQIAGEFFDHPSHHFDCVAVTGTNGKTSVAHFTAMLAAELGVRAGFLGTTGWGFVGGQDKAAALKPAALTTADAVSLQERLHELGKGGAELVALELSSHALQQHRGSALGVDIALFTNLSRDHLDYHGSMERYGAAKARLFQFPSLRGMAINVDDTFGARLLVTLKAGDSNRPVLGLVTESAPIAAQQNSLRVSHLSSSSEGMSWQLTSPWGEIELSSQIIGRYNAMNISLAVVALALLGHELSSIAAAVPALIAPAGRLQRVGRSPSVFVDYAHTPDALVSVLQAAREHCTGQLICVFGCGGDRDPGKRGSMGQAVANYADVGWLTSDNPRFENPAAIIADVEAGLANNPAMRSKIHSELDRRIAITQAITAAGTDDLVIIAGKGHEDYQDIEGVRHPFDDALVAQAALAVRATQLEGAR